MSYARLALITTSQQAGVHVLPDASLLAPRRRLESSRISSRAVLTHRRRPACVLARSLSQPTAKLRTFTLPMNLGTYTIRCKRTTLTAANYEALCFRWVRHCDGIGSFHHMIGLCGVYRCKQISTMFGKPPSIFEHKPVRILQFAAILRPGLAASRRQGVRPAAKRPLTADTAYRPHATLHGRFQLRLIRSTSVQGAMLSLRCGQRAAHARPA